MIGPVRSWLLRITTAALIAALAGSLMPKGPVKEVGRLACALLLLWAVLSPVLQLRLPDVRQTVQQWQAEAEGRRQELEEQNASMLKSFIERETAAYIVDKAAQLGAECSARVVCTAGEGGTWLPWSAEISGELTGEQQKALEKILAEELDIPAERQGYTGGEKP